MPSLWIGGSEAKSLSRLYSEVLRSSGYNSKFVGGGGNEENVSMDVVDFKVLVDSVKEDDTSPKGVLEYSMGLLNLLSTKNWSFGMPLVAV